MKTTLINDKLQNIVRGIHRSMREKNPSIADIQHELSARYAIDLTEFEIGDLVLEAGRRGYSSTNDRANTASKFAAHAAFQAINNKDRQSHLVALEAHRDAAEKHIAASNYHVHQAAFHAAAANNFEARRGVVVSIAELKARKLAEFEGQKAHCANCNSDFAIADAEQRSAENYTCPNCGETVNVTAGKKEEVDENQQPTEARREPWSWLNETFTEPPKAVAEQQSQQAPALMLDCARSASSLLPDELPNHLLYMPAGLHTITPSQGGKPVTVTVLVDENAATQLEKQRQALAASGNQPFFSIQHNTQVAAFWPTKFTWDARLDSEGRQVTGVYALGNWSKSGLEAVEGRDFRSFSPTFFVDKISIDPENPARVVANPDAKLNMGALENDPAFTAIAPLWK
jgi:predicted RNA-binding Zn-ribbon protein involved in translation (DUF1610 family)